MCTAFVCVCVCVCVCVFMACVCKVGAVLMAVLISLPALTATKLVFICPLVEMHVNCVRVHHDPYH